LWFDFKIYSYEGNATLTWQTNNEACWFDYGFEEVDRESVEEKKRTFDLCKTPCREINGSHYYYCVMAHTVAKNMKLGIGQQDFMEIGAHTDKNVVLEFELGYSDKGYLDMCGKCRGKEAEKYLIPAAEQVGEESRYKNQ
jgi:hypothetical protein